MSKVKTIGVLTSGGDAPGMNAAIRSVVRMGLAKGYKMVTVRKGYAGLLNGDIHEVSDKFEVSEIIHRGGTYIHTARSKEFYEEEGKKKGAEMCKTFGIDALVVIGGDGSYKGALGLSKYGVNVIGLPGTIDLDIACTDYTIGFDTAINTAMHSINQIRDTSNSHDRCSIVEVMGREAGHIALWCGIAGGADVILVPEHKESINEDDIVKRVLENQNMGKTHSLIVVAEGVGGSVELAKRIEDRTGIVTRATILGYVQRGGSPTAIDRVHASMMGAKAVELIDEGKKNRIVCHQKGKYVDYDIDKALAMTKGIDEHMFTVANIIG